MALGPRQCLSDVELLPRSIAVQSSQCFEAGLNSVASGIDVPDLGGSQSSTGFELIAFAAERSDLALVRPPQHPPAWVIHGVPVILVVTFTGADLAFPSDRFSLPTKRLQGWGAPVVGTLGDLRREVLAKQPVLYLDAVRQ